MMEIPAGKSCDECPFCARDSEYESDCQMFEDPTINKTHYDAHVTLLHDADGDGRCSQCLSAYPNGAVVEIKPK